MRHLVLTLALAVAIGGCANLQEVRDFAGESAQLSAYANLTTRFRDTYQREEPYLFDEAAQLAQQNDARRQAAYADLLRIQTTVALYMQTLAQLAGESTYNLSKGIGAVSGQITAHPEFGIDPGSVDAYTKVIQTVAKWASSYAQEQAVRGMVKDGGPAMQTMLDGMQKIAGIYRRAHESEKKTVLGFLETNIAKLTDASSRPLVALLRVQYQTKQREYADADALYAAAERGIKSVADGHRELLKDIDHLSLQQTRDKLKQYRNDIKAVRQALDTLPR